MDRCSESTKAVDKFGPGKHGYSEGSPGVTPRTIIGEDALNAFQEEIVRAIEAVGLTPDSADLGQLAAAIAKGPPCASYKISGSGVTTGNRFTLGSFSSEPPAATPNANNFTLSSNKVAVTYEGLYRVTIFAVWTDTGTGGVDSHLQLCSDQGNNLIFGVRGTTDAGDLFVSSFTLYRYLDAGDEIWLEPGVGSHTNSISTGAISGAYHPSQFSLERVSKF